MFADESTVMELLIYAGQARSDAMEAIAASRQRETLKTHAKREIHWQTPVESLFSYPIATWLRPFCFA